VEDITDDGLLVRSTKFRKDRLVPLHDSTREGIRYYLSYRIQYSGIEHSLFISTHGRRLSYSTVNSIFLQLVRSIGLRHGPGHPGFCIHDLRHRFAVKSLEECAGDPVAISHHMVSLSTYLGHAHISDTYWYLHATPLLMKQIAAVQEKTFYRRENHV
jgi:integrase